jgi:hypothetical protein
MSERVAGLERKMENDERRRRNNNIVIIGWRGEGRASSRSKRALKIL